MRVVLSLLLLSLGVSSVTPQELADASNIMQDLSSYSKLYVTYQNCAWSPYDSGDNNNNACGVEAGEDEYWYLGLTECFRTNVAYSLYGVLKGQEDKGCNKATFINSFFTTTGIATFTDYMALAGVTFTAAADGESEVTSECTMVEDNNGNQDNAAVDYSANNVKVNGLATSYGVGCVDTSNGFALKTYTGAYCDERISSGVTDTLDTFNSDIGQVQCIAIYDDATVAEDGGQNDGTVLGLLAYSQACDVNLFPDQCPDPYGKIKSVTRSSSHSLAAQGNPRREMVKTVFSWLFMGFGIVLMLGSAVAYFRKMQSRDASKASRAKKGAKKGLFSRSKSQDGGDTSGDKKTSFFARARSMFSRK